MKKDKLILDRDAGVLREKAAPVAVIDIGSRKIISVIEKMKKALHGEDDGVAIAAPQIGVGLRIFVVKGEALAMTRENGSRDEKLEDLIFINPEIVKTSKKKRKMEEGCLSIRWLYGEVLRHDKVTVKAYNEKGEAILVGASGLIAQIFQHEIDHLDGILFIDKAENIRDLPPAENKEQ